MHAEIAALNRIRLEENLSYYELGLRCRLPEPTIRRILQAAEPQVYDRTLYRIRAYLAQRRKQTAARRRRAARTRTERPRSAEATR